MRRLEGGVEDDGGNARLRGFLDRPLQGPAVERRQDDPLDALADEALDDLDLLLAVVLADRALPEDADRRPGGRELGRRLGMTASVRGAAPPVAPLPPAEPSPPVLPPALPQPASPAIATTMAPIAPTRYLLRFIRLSSRFTRAGAARHYHGPTMSTGRQP